MNELNNSDPIDEECDGEGGGRGWLSGTDQITYENISLRGQCNSGVRRGSRRVVRVSGTGKGNHRDWSQPSYTRHETTAFGLSGCGFGDGLMLGQGNACGGNVGDMPYTERKGIKYAE